MNDLHQIEPRPGVRLAFTLVVVIVGLAAIVCAAVLWGRP